MAGKALFARLDPQRIPPMVGQESHERLAGALRILQETAWPLYLTGPSGSGKTLMAMTLAARYSAAHGVPAYYVQLSPEMTKTSLILGLRLVAGSLEVVDGVVAQCMKEGGIIVIDEAAHTTHELLLMLNSVLDRTSVTSVGDTIVYAEESFRVVLCANDSSYAGNVRLPQSFAQRLVALAFDYPGFDNELAITHAIAEAECRSPLTVPDSVARHVVATMRLLRTGAYPLSARNAAIILVLLNLAERKATSELDPYFTDPDTAEAKRRAAAVRVLGKGDEDLEVGDLRAPAVEEFLAFVSAVGVQRFREAFLAGSMYHLDVDGLELDEQAVRSAIAGQIL